MRRAWRKAGSRPRRSVSRLVKRGGLMPLGIGLFFSPGAQPLDRDWNSQGLLHLWQRRANLQFRPRHWSATGNDAPIAAIETDKKGLGGYTAPTYGRACFRRLASNDDTVLA